MAPLPLFPRPPRPPSHAATARAWLYAAFVRPGKNLRSYGSWAVATGATDGIGKALAAELARAGLHLVLVGRNPVKLDRTVDEIAAVAGCEAAKTKRVVVDLTADLAEGIARIEEMVEALDVGMLVNFAGVTYPHAMYFHDAGEEMWGGIVQVNSEATARVARTVLSGMVRRGRSVVVDIGSADSISFS